MAGEPGNINKGSARPQQQNASEPGASFDPNQENTVSQDPTKTVLNQSFSTEARTAGKVVYDNILENFSTYSALWTLACLEPAQSNNPSLYRNAPDTLNHVVFSSAGRYNEKRTATVNGSPEYFVDNVSINALVTPISSGNTNAVQFTFEVYEPYSMGLFLQSLLFAAQEAGYPNYLGEVPYLLKLDFIGNTDDGNLSNNIVAFTKFFTLRITNVTLKVDGSGSRYAVSAIPFSHIGYSDANDSTKTDTKLTGGTVAEVLATGENSLVAHLNKIAKEQVDDKHQSIPDIYEIVFPVDESDPLGVTQTSTPFSLGATVDPKKILPQTISSSKSPLSLNIGGNPISQASMNFSAEIGGNYVHPKENEVIDNQSGLTNRGKVKIDPTVREFHFDSGEKITRIIQKVILVSNYAAAAIDPGNLVNGMVKWFRVDLQIQLLDYDEKRLIRAKKYTYRIIPYLVDGSILSNPSAPAAGVAEKNEIIIKRYDYIYTGKNNNILNLNLEFNSMFFTASVPRAMDKTGTNNPDTSNAVDVQRQSAGLNSGGSSAIAAATGVPTVNVDPSTVKRSPIGQKTIKEQIADVFQTRFQTSSADMVNVEMEIMGDPYFLSDSGINSNYFSPKGFNSQITGDNALNYEGSDILVYVTFRTPVEPNLSINPPNGSLYSFQNNGGISPYSGIFKITQIENKFANGNFSQVLKMIRPPAQQNDLLGRESIVKDGLSQFTQLFNVPPGTSPAADSMSNRGQEQGSSLDNYLDKGLGLVNSTGQIAKNVASGNFLGALGSFGSLLGGSSKSSEAARVNQRPSSQKASSASETTSSSAPSSDYNESDVDPRLIEIFKKDEAEIARDKRRDALFARYNVK